MTGAQRVAYPGNDEYRTQPAFKFMARLVDHIPVNCVQPST